MLSNDEKVMLSNSGKALDNYSSFESIRNKQSSDEDMIDIRSVQSLNNGEQKGFTQLTHCFHFFVSIVLLNCY